MHAQRRFGAFALLTSFLAGSLAVASPASAKTHNVEMTAVETISRH